MRKAYLVWLRLKNGETPVIKAGLKIAISKKKKAPTSKRWNWEEKIDRKMRKSDLNGKLWKKRDIWILENDEERCLKPP